MYNYERNMFTTTTATPVTKSSSIVIPIYGNHHNNVIKNVHYSNQNKNTKLKNSISNVSSNSYTSSSSSSGGGSAAALSQSISSYSTIPSNNSNLVLEYDAPVKRQLFPQQQITKKQQSNINNFDISYPYSASSSSASSLRSNTNNECLFIKETDIIDDEDLIVKQPQQQQQQQPQLHYNTLPSKPIKQRKALNDINFLQYSNPSSPKYNNHATTNMPSRNNNRNSDDFNKAIIYNYHKNKNKNHRPPMTTTTTTTTAFSASTLPTNNKIRQQQRKSEQLFEPNPGLNEISNKLFFLNSNTNNNRTTTNTPLTMNNNNKQQQAMSSTSNNNNNNNRFYSLRRILSKKLSNTDLTNKAVKYDSVQPPPPPPFNDNNNKKQALNIMKIYKNVLNRLQKKFNFNEPSSTTTTQEEVVLAATRVQLPESPLMSLQTGTMRLVDASTQTAIATHSIEKSIPCFYNNNNKSSSVVSSASSSSSSSTSASLLSNYSLNKRGNSKQKHGQNNISESQEDILCDLEVASYFDTRQPEFNTNTNNATLFYSTYEYGTGSLKKTAAATTQAPQVLVFENNVNKKQSYYLTHNKYNSENYSDFGTLC